MKKIQEILMFSSDSKTYKSIEVLILVIYGCALPFSIILALFWPLEVDALPNATLLYIFGFLTFLIPISIVLTFVKYLHGKHKSVGWLLLPIFVVLVWYTYSTVSQYYLDHTASQTLH